MGVGLIETFVWRKNRVRVETRGLCYDNASGGHTHTV